jgi:hypothetical protein
MKREEIDPSNVPWASLSPEDRERVREERRRAGSRIRVIGVLVVLFLLILPMLFGQFGIGLSLLFASAYAAYCVASMKHYGTVFLRDMDWGVITKRKNPILFQIEVFSAYGMAILLFVIGIYCISQS